MERFTLSLALFDYLPVMAGVLGMYFVCRYCSQIGRQRGLWVFVIPLILAAGGLFKASWKTWVVVAKENIVWMSDQLFFFISTGYILIAALVVLSVRAFNNNSRLSPGWWYVPAAIAAIAVSTALWMRLNGEGRTWSFLLLGVLSVANLVIFLRLITHSLSQRNRLSALGFSISLVLGYTLVGLARLPDQTLELQWIEQTLNFISNSILAGSAWLLLRRFSDAQRTTT